MKTRGIWRRARLALLGLSASIVASAVLDAALAPERLVLAYHYPWYGYKPPDNWDQQKNIADHPLLGPYRSEDPALIDFQVSLARDAGLDGFIVSWGGPETKQDEILLKMLEHVERPAAGDFSLCVLCEAYAGKSDLNPAKVQRELGYAVGTLGKRKGYLRAGGKPVVFIYTPQGWPAKRWRETFDAVTKEHGRTLFIAVADDWNFDLDYLAAFDSFGPYADKYIADDKLLRAHALIAERLRGTAGPHIASIIGGGSHIKKLGFDIDRAQGRYIRDRFALAQKAGADWLTITSWNEWYESMQIEPSREYGFEQIKVVREIAHEFKGRPLPISFTGVRLVVASAVPKEPARDGETAQVTLTVTNRSAHNLYAVTCRREGGPDERVAYVLHPHESRTVQLVLPGAPPTPSALTATVQAFLPDGEIVSTQHRLGSISAAENHE
ncbi:MAG: hypothetical protein HYY24_13355 [Verrucomicrobia bacterium]|nr:hypothetical protein [Verrucomicrobiota bacterium]